MARKLDQILVVDVESTCWDGPPPEGEEGEIIEICLCVVDVGKLERLSKHSLLVRPERSTISAFCTELTTLTPDMFEAAGSFRDAAKRLKQEFDSKDRLWASWGDYDRRQFERVCSAAGDGYPIWMSLFAPLRPLVRRILLPKVLSGDSPRGIRMAPMFVPPDKLEDATEVEAFAASVGRLLNHSGSFAPHPGFGRLPREKILENHTAHAAHHLRHLRAEGDST